MEIGVINAGAMGLIGSGTRRVEPHGDIGPGVWKEKNKKWGVLSHVGQSEEGMKGAEQVALKLIDFKNFWKETFKPNGEREFQPSKELTRSIFVKARELEHDLNTLFINNPDALKAWHPSDNFSKSDLQHKASETAVLEREKVDTVWQRAIDQIDGHKSRQEYMVGSEKEGRSWVIDALGRLNEIVQTERVNVTPFTTMSGPYKENYEIFKRFVLSNEKDWTKQV